MKIKIDRQKGYAILGLFAVMLVVVAASKMMENSENTASTTTLVQTSATTTVPAASPEGVVKVEVYHFHGTHQCYSCITVGALAEKTVNTYFKKELDSGVIVFGHVNGDLPENRELVQKYGAGGSSLWIGTYVDGAFHKEENVNVWYKINNEDDYMSYLKGVIEQKLAEGQ